MLVEIFVSASSFPNVSISAVQAESPIQSFQTERGTAVLPNVSVLRESDVHARPERSTSDVFKMKIQQRGSSLLSVCIKTKQCKETKTTNMEAEMKIK